MSKKRKTEKGEAVAVAVEVNEDAAQAWANHWRGTGLRVRAFPRIVRADGEWVTVYMMVARKPVAVGVAA